MYTLHTQVGTRATAAELVLHEGDLSYELRHLDITSDEHRSAEFLAVNPRGTVPALVTDGRTVACETIAIMMYLCDRHRLEHLAPAPEDESRGVMIDWITYHATEVQEPIKRYFYAHRHGGTEQVIQDVRDRARLLFNERWQLVENHLRDGGPFHLGDRFSIVDLYLLVTGSFSTPVEDQEYPAIKRCIDLTASRPKVADIYAKHLEGLRNIVETGVPR